MIHYWILWNTKKRLNANNKDKRNMCLFTHPTIGNKLSQNIRVCSFVNPKTDLVTRIFPIFELQKKTHQVKLSLLKTIWAKHDNLLTLFDHSVLVLYHVVTRKTLNDLQKLFGMSGGNSISQVISVEHKNVSRFQRMRLSVLLLQVWATRFWENRISLSGYNARIKLRKAFQIMV